MDFIAKKMFDGQVDGLKKSVFGDEEEEKEDPNKKDEKKKSKAQADAEAVGNIVFA
jgi:hypothetical protein